MRSFWSLLVLSGAVVFPSVGRVGDFPGQATFMLWETACCQTGAQAWLLVVSPPSVAPKGDVVVGETSPQREIGEKLLKSFEINRNQSKSIKIGRHRSKSVEIHRYQLKSVEIA